MPKFIRVPQGRICRLVRGSGFSGLYTDDFSSCNIIVFQGKNQEGTGSVALSMIHADPSTDPITLVNEKHWIDEEQHSSCSILIFYKDFRIPNFAL